MLGKVRRKIKGIHAKSKKSKKTKHLRIIKRNIDVRVENK